MSLVYLKQLRDKERRELPIETWEGLTVKELRETASRALAIPLDVFSELHYTVFLLITAPLNNN